MLYKVDDNKNEMSVVNDEWDIKEKELENLLINKSSKEKDAPSILSFGFKDDDLLVIDNQLRTRSGKIIDILALDKRGDAVIVELKKDTAKLGVEIQALQYLAAYSWLKGGLH